MRHGWLALGSLFFLTCNFACVLNESSNLNRPSYDWLRPYRSPRLNADRVQPVRAYRSEKAWYPKYKRIDDRWRFIVIHHSATERGGAKVFDKDHRENRGWDELGYHFVIGNGTNTVDGEIEVGSRWHKQKHGAHCRTADNLYNEHGIGICLVGDFTRMRPTRKQLASLRRLVRFLCNQCSMPPERIITHRHINRKTLCPGRHFSLESLRRSVSAGKLASRSPSA